MVLATRDMGRCGIGWYVESEGGGNVGRERWSPREPEGVLGRSMKMRRRTERVDAADEERERGGAGWYDGCSSGRGEGGRLDGSHEGEEDEAASAYRGEGERRGARSLDVDAR